MAKHEYQAITQELWEGAILNSLTFQKQQGIIPQVGDKVLVPYDDYDVVHEILDYSVKFATVSDGRTERTMGTHGIVLADIIATIGTAYLFQNCYPKVYVTNPNTPRNAEDMANEINKMIKG